MNLEVCTPEVVVKYVLQIRLCESQMVVKSNVECKFLQYFCSIGKLTEHRVECAEGHQCFDRFSILRLRIWCI